MLFAKTTVSPDIVIDTVVSTVSVNGSMVVNWLEKVDTEYRGRVFPGETVAPANGASRPDMQSNPTVHRRTVRKFLRLARALMTPPITNGLLWVSATRTRENGTI
jgi:hypothetical protein